MNGEQARKPGAALDRPSAAVPPVPLRARGRLLVSRLVDRIRTSRLFRRILPTRRAGKQAIKDAVAWLLRSPLRLTGAIGRGLLAALRAWRRWVRVQDYRDAVEQAEKLAEKFVEIRALTLYRWRVTGIAALAVLGGLVVVDLVAGPSALWSTVGAGLLGLAVAGRRKDGASGRTAALGGPRTLAWTMDPQVLVDAFRDAKLIGRDESLRLVERATHSGGGWSITVDLPATRKAADVLKHRDALASALAVDEVQLVAERVRGRGGHAGRVFLWVADVDPYGGPPFSSPLVRAETWDAWRPVPFGRDARRRKVDLSLVWTSLLVGAIPRQGKTMAVRLAAAGFILDAFARLYVFDGKGGKDWRAAEAVAHRFVCGDDQAQAEAVRDGLVELVAEVQSRYARMAELDDETCPESKITPQLSRDPAHRMPITAVILDEVQVFLDNPTKLTVGERGTTLGEYIADLLAYLARKGPAAGIIVVLATQRPDSQTIPSRLRSVLGTRFALRVMDWRDSNIVLGDQMNTRGYDASTLLPSHKGVGILRPDGETDAGADAVAVTVRTFYLTNAEWRAVCTRGRLLREIAGTLSGHAVGEHAARAIDSAAVTDALSAGPVSWNAERLPEPLRGVVEFLGEELRPGGRRFVPTAELTDALDVEPSGFARQMGELGCRPTRQYVPEGDGVRRVRGYLTAEIRDAVDRVRAGEISPSEDDADGAA
ncbi:S-DNA-T family DNA segregation ATPase FtsK/SpoIIIE [Actinoalloteichus hoggarensis]|uniref:DNA translocase FtsK n=1 Tax=Actinoalloteichus hoggarensis TaxID=1470176 RepID=A0A221W408_9PSEU|nr:FtsK/SpoIIIE domain-containing protein [Actinoalloteichus hoggarensis]ASO20555.1 DNA translocase FtsK [Actinoalloteichus hoggarensis]MBB5923595.1 S-DNA-T family DNA segregation ATPase FtsK/SpoIIIE [Actinoalloteichus hoggarensis]